MVSSCRFDATDAQITTVSRKAIPDGLVLHEPSSTKLQEKKA